MLCINGFNFFMEILKQSPHNYLEIGVYDGDCISKLAKAYPGKQFYGVDPFIEDGCTSVHTNVEKGQPISLQKDQALRATKGLSNVKLLEMTSVDFSKHIDDDLIKLMDIAWVLIDGSHEYKDVVNDYKLALRLIGNRSGGIVFDDTDIPEVRRAYREFLTNTSGIGFGINVTRSYPPPTIFHSVND